MWNIQLFGGLAVSGPQRQLTRFRTQKAASLLGYLAFHASAQNQPRPRETIVGMFWPDAEPDAGRHNLSNALSFLRNVLEPRGVPSGTVVLADRSSVRLNPAATTVDVVEFEGELTKAEAQHLTDDERMALLLRAAERYQGPLLPGDYEEWVAPQAVRLENMFVRCVVRLVPMLLKTDKRESAVSFAQRAAAADPLSEDATLCLMQALVASGQVSPALRAYRTLAQRLQGELGAEPSAELQELAALLGKGATARKPAGIPDVAPPVEHVQTYSGRSSLAVDRQEIATQLETTPAEPRGRLIGGEFLLRTTAQFFGREDELARLTKMLSTPRTRLVTLTGPGGTGKTRLALEVAAQMVELPSGTRTAESPMSAAFVPLASVTEADRLFDTTLRTLGLVPATNQDPLDQLAQALDSQPNALLVLDNFEQLAEEGAMRAHELLGKSGSVTLLITSRQRLNIEGEREFHLAPLPTCGGFQALEEMQRAPSVALFVDRAQAALPDFRLTERNAPAVSQLCDYLEGLPLAIELAAARLALLTPARILEQVQANRLDFLATRRRDAESRQKTLRATLDWSYQLLPEPARVFLAALSAFRGGWTLSAAAAVCALDEDETLELVTLLRDSSLVQVMDTEEGLRFTVLETIREYGQEKLQERGEDSAVRRRHRDYFVEFLKQAEPELSGPVQALWLNCLQIDHDNLCAAVEWSETDQTSAQVDLWLVGTMSRFWEVRGYLRLGRQYLDRALNRADASAPTADRAKALQGAGLLARNQGDYTSARALLAESLTIRREFGDKGGIATSLINLGIVAHYQGENATGKPLFEEGLAISRELGDKGGIATSLLGLGATANHQGDYDGARTLLQESLATYRELGDKGGSAYSLYCQGALACAQGNYEAASALLEESLAFRRELGEKRNMAYSLYGLGNVAGVQGDYGTALALFEESLAICRELGDRRGIAYSLSGQAIVASSQGDYEAAKPLLEEILVISRELGNKRGIAQSIYYVGIVASSHGDYGAGPALLGESLTRYRQVRHTYIIHMLGLMGHVSREVGDYAQAATHYQESLRLRREMGDLLATAQSLEEFAGLAGRQGQFERAVRLLGAAEALYATLGRTPPAGDVAEYERTVAAARSGLSAEAFAAVWEKGRKIALDVAVAYAMEKAADTV